MRSLATAAPVSPPGRSSHMRSRIACCSSDESRQTNITPSPFEKNKKKHGIDVRERRRELQCRSWACSSKSANQNQSLASSSSGGPCVHTPACFHRTRGGEAVKPLNCTLKHFTSLANTMTMIISCVMWHVTRGIRG